ncbi:MAG: DUF883 C-terminal domain-containing protein [Gammaproteobacteria bacterium]
MRTTPSAQNGEQLDRKVDRAADQAHDKIDQASNAAQPAVDRLAGKAHNMVDKLEAKGEQWMEAEEEMMGEIQAYVRQHPLQSVGIAVAGGFLLSRILSSR